MGSGWAGDNELGITSQIFAVLVDQTCTAFAHHVVDVSAEPTHTSGLSLVSLTHADDLSDLTTEETEQTQGSFQIEVVFPHHTLSDVASSNMSCTTRGLCRPLYSVLITPALPAALAPAAGRPYQSLR
jgi:hypothetical protein